MSDSETKTITISADEYFDLRTKAQMNDFLIREFGRIEGLFMDVDRRIAELELKHRQE